MTNRGGRPPKLDEYRAQDMRQARAAGMTFDKIARLWNVSRSTARRYVADQCRQHKERRA